MMRVISFFRALTRCFVSRSVWAMFSFFLSSFASSPRSSLSIRVQEIKTSLADGSIISGGAQISGHAVSHKLQPWKCKSLQFDRRLLKVQPPTTHEPDFVSCKLDRERINIQILILFYCFQSSWQIYCNLQSQIWTLKGQYSEKISFVPFIVTSNIVINKIHISKIAHFLMKMSSRRPFY